MSADRKPFYQPALALAAAALLAIAGLLQHQLNSLRRDPDLGLSRFTRIDSSQAPPFLAFITVALGSFRGIIANILWLRATDLQDQGKYFEMVQLADWITKLEPTFTQVWLVQAWNMAYNISVKFTDPADRWRWVQRGIELLRDDAIRYNPKEPMIYRELAWFFQHKMGEDMDNAHRYYKTQWALEMTDLFGGPTPDFQELLNPATPEARLRASRLREHYKMDPAFMQEVDRQYGPLEWRLPEAHAIYWASVGLEDSFRTNLVFLRRAILQPSQMSVFRGRIVRLPDRTDEYLVTGPDLNKVKLVNSIFERMIEDEEVKKDPIRTAQHNFLHAAVFTLYTHGRLAEARYWYDYLGNRYPQQVVPNQSLEDYVMERHLEDIGTLSYDKSVAVLEGFLVDSYLSLALGDVDRAEGMMSLAAEFWNLCYRRMSDQQERLGLPPFEQIKQAVVQRLLAPDSRIAPTYQAQLRTALNLPAPTPPATNAPPQ